MENYSVYYYMRMFLRHKNIFAVCFVAMFIASSLFASRWSAYRSTATIQVVPSDIPEGMTVPTGMNPAELIRAMAGQKIGQIQQIMTSTANLVDIITKFGLYPKERLTVPISDIAIQMAKKIHLQMVHTEIEKTSGASREDSQSSTFTFSLSFDYSDPLKTQQVTNELVSRFLDEDLKQRRTQTKATSAFLAAQIDDVESSMVRQEKEIATFREQHPISQPESVPFNQQMLAKTSLGLQDIQSQIAKIDRNRSDLRAQLATTDPYSRVLEDGQTVSTPAAQLKALETKFATLSARYGPDHPDVVRLSRQIEAMKAAGGDSSESVELRAHIDELRTKLAAMEKAYGAEYPDTRVLRREIEALKGKQASLRKDKPARSDIVTDADNPAYLLLVTRLHTMDEEYDFLLKQRTAAERQYEQYQRAVAEAPLVEQQFAALTRDYESAKQRYRELKQKKLVADMSQQMELDRKAQRLTVLNPPDLPTKTKPPRKVLLAGGFLFSVAVGLGGVVAAEFLSRGVYGAAQLAAVTGTMPLVTIAHIGNNEDRRKTRRRRIAIAIACAAALVAVVVLFAKFVMPLDVLASVLAMRLGIH